MTSNSIITKAEKLCAATDARLTEPRRAVIDILSKTSKAMTAYDVLDALGTYLDNPKPPTVYRAIEFWQNMGLIHRIESLNAYIICDAGHGHKGSQFLICDDCENVTEVHLCNVPESLAAKAKDHEFNMSYWSAELHGQCGRCSAHG